MYQSSFFMKRLWVWNWNGINCFKHNFLRAFCVKLTLLSTQPLAHVSVSDLGNINKISNLYNELDLLFQMTHLILLCLASISKKNNICNTLWLAVRNVCPSRLQVMIHQSEEGRSSYYVKDHDKPCSPVPIFYIFEAAFAHRKLWTYKSLAWN